MAYTPGIDVSRYQGEIDWEKVAAAGYKFAVLRATIGDYYTDPRFYSNWSGAKAAGLLVSAYHVVVATNYAQKQIARFSSVLDGRKTDFPPVLDIELDKGVSKAANTACIQDCIREMQSFDGRRPVIYTAYYYWKDHVLASSDWGQYDLWVATYSEKPMLPPGWSDWKFWQYSSGGRVPGISGSTDMNYFNGTGQELIAYAGQSAQPVEDVSTKLQAQVTVTQLNVRSGPSTSFKKITTLQFGDRVNVIDIGGSDVWIEHQPGKWSACFYAGQQYMELNPPETAGEDFKARVLVDRLRVRSGPALTYAVLDHLNTGDSITVQGIGGKNAWIEHDLGRWSAMCYGTDKYMQLVA